MLNYSYDSTTMIKNSILGFCVIVIIACFVKIHNLNTIVSARVIPSVQKTLSYNTMCVRVTNETLLNEFVSFHISQGFLTFVFYGSANFTELNHVYSDYGLNLRYKSNVENIEWDCILDSVFDPEISHVVILDNDQFIFPLSSKYDVISYINTCQLLEEYNFIYDDNEQLITKNTKRERYTNYNNKKAIIPLGKTSKERIKLLRNYSMETLFNTCTLSKKHGIASFTTNQQHEIINDRRLLRMHYKVTIGRR